MKAKESRQIQKARKKLEKQMQTEHQRINQKAIDQMKKAMQVWIKRHEDERISLEDLPVELFDENRHSAKTKSKFVTHLMDQLTDEAAKTKSYKPLIGRIKK